MQSFGQPWGMWVLFFTSFEKHLAQEFSLPAKTAKAVTAKAGQTDRRLIADLPDFEKEDRFAMNIVNAAMRRTDLAWEVRDYLRTHPAAAVVNLGCGLDNTGRSCDNGTCRIYNLDLPDVIAVRGQLLPAGGCGRRIFPAT